MRRLVLFVLAGVIVLLLGTSAMLFQMHRQAVAAVRAAETRESTARAEFERAFGAIAEIQDSLDSLASADVPMRLRAEGPEASSRTVEQRRREALARVAALDERIRRNKVMIQDLETGLRKGGVRIAGLERTISALKRSVAREEEKVAQLTESLRATTEQVTALQTEVERRDEAIRTRETMIEEKRRELATIYYVIGTKKELVRAGVVVAEGGLLGVGRSLRVSPASSDSSFTPLDTDRDSIVRIPARKAVVLSSQPAGSYALEREHDTMRLVIRDPRAFRTVHHLVIRSD
jgi:hypothetical protein